MLFLTSTQKLVSKTLIKTNDKTERLNSYKKKKNTKKYNIFLRYFFCFINPKTTKQISFYTIIFLIKELIELFFKVIFNEKRLTKTTCKSFVFVSVPWKTNQHQ